MAKKENLTYMQMPLPTGQNSYKITKVNWIGLNKSIDIDSGALSAESNISTDNAPYLSPSQKRIIVNDVSYSNPISLFGFDDFLLVIYRDSTNIKIDYIKGVNKYTGILKSGATSADEIQRCVVKFNVYSDPTDPINGTFVNKLIIFPDKKSIDFVINSDFTPDAISGMPDIKYATVYLSRLFGVDNGRVYASEFNDYSGWIVDNPDLEDGYNANNAWCSPVGANTNSDGIFTGITTYENHVICFKSDFMHEIYNNKNPFRVQDIYPEGAIDNRSIQNVDGRLIFVDKDFVKIYTGGNPRIISHNLGIKSFYKAVSGTDGRKYYVYCKTDQSTHNLFVYDTMFEQWSEENIDFEILSFAHNKNGIYALGENGYIYKIDSGGYAHDWYCETDLFIGKTIDIKHVKKIQVLADIEENAELKIYCLYGNENYSSNSHKVYDSDGSTGRKTIRVIPRQTSDYGFKLRFSGYGKVKIYQMELFMTQGGELYI